MNGSVLVVAHDRDLAMLLATIVRLRGRRAIIARRSSSALAHARRYQPSLVLVDTPTPGVQVADLVRDLRLRLPAALIVLLSARDEYEQLAQTLPVDGYVARPFDIAQIFRYLYPHDRPIEQAIGAW